jgi:HSP20 family protein
MKSLTKNPSRSLRPYRSSFWGNPIGSSWLSPIDRFFDEDIFNAWSSRPSTIPSVNIREEKNNYRVEVAAPGLKKDDFNIDVEGNVVTISSEKESERKDGDKDSDYSRWEYDYSSFSRSFTLPDLADTDKISAKYTDGILHIDIPKKPEAARISSRKINIQ